MIRWYTVELIENSSAACMSGRFVAAYSAADAVTQIEIKQRGNVPGCRVYDIKPMGELPPHPPLQQGPRESGIKLSIEARVAMLEAGLAALDRAGQEAFRRIEALETHVKRLEEDRPAPDSCDMRAPLPELGEEIGEEVDGSPDCNCETCPQGGPYTCIRHD